MKESKSVLADDLAITFMVEGTPAAKIAWSEVDRVVAYKLDMFTTDSVFLNIYSRSSNDVLTVGEDLHGYQVLKAQIKKSLPRSVPDWEAQVILPPFRRNETVIYDARWGGAGKGELWGRLEARLTTLGTEFRGQEFRGQVMN